MTVSRALINTLEGTTPLSSRLDANSLLNVHLIYRSRYSNDI